MFGVEEYYFIFYYVEGHLLMAKMKNKY